MLYTVLLETVKDKTEPCKNLYDLVQVFNNTEGHDKLHCSHPVQILVGYLSGTQELLELSYQSHSHLSI